MTQGSAQRRLPISGARSVNSVMTHAFPHISFAVSSSMDSGQTVRAPDE